MSSSPAAPSTTATSPQTQGALYAVIVLTAMNLLNYIDRWVPSAVKDSFKTDLKLTDQETSLPLSAFIIVYMIFSPIFGSLADRWSRKKLIAVGVAVWSLATAGAAFATGFGTLLLARALVGIGEAAYATIAPSILSDFFPPEKRNRIFTIFYVAIPVGSAIGFVAGGLLGEALGWRFAFLICGLPGLLVALTALAIKEPPRGQFDAEKVAPPSWPEALKALSRNKQYLFAVAGYTAVTFGTGGIADWFPTFLSRDRGMSMGEAGSLVGTVTVIGGLGGTIIGGIVADQAKRFTRHAYFAASGLAIAPAVALIVVAIYVVQAPMAILGCILVAQIFLWFYNAPINALVVNSVDGGMRARAFGMSILTIHILGDVISPPLIGAVNDRVQNLSLSLVMVPVAIAIGGLVWLVGWRTLPEPSSSQQQQQQPSAPSASPPEPLSAPPSAVGAQEQASSSAAVRAVSDTKPDSPSSSSS